MNQKKTDRLKQNKLSLAAKYDRLCTEAGSKTKRKQFSNRAEHYRRQAEELDG